MTNNMARRASEQAARGLAIRPIRGLGNLTRADARAVEQVLIEKYGLAKNGGTLLNKINSISPLNPNYGGSIIRGRQLLNQAGYSGF